MKDNCSSSTLAVVALIVSLPLGAPQGLSWVGVVEATTLFVSPDGDDANQGTVTAPVATIDRARQLVRQQLVRQQLVRQQLARRVDPTARDSIEVILAAGTYRLRESVVWTDADSGTAEHPVVYRGIDRKHVRLTGGIELESGLPRRVTDPAVLSRLLPDVRSRIVQVDLRAQGIDDFGVIGPRGFRRPYIPAPLEVFVNDQPLAIARWPNPDQPRIPIGKVLDKGSVTRFGEKPERGGKFHYSTDRPARWNDANDIWISGLFENGYADSTVQVASLDHEHKVLTTAHPHMYGFASGKSWQSWYALNLLEEIDLPGEYFTDRETGILYFLPPEGVDLPAARIQVSVFEDPLLVFEGARHVHLENFTLECSRGMGVYIERGEDVRITGCTMRNLGMVAVCIGQGTTPDPLYQHGYTGQPISRSLGSWHEHIYNNTTFNRRAGRNHAVDGCEMYHLGAGGVSLGGGDRKTLQPAGNRVVNCDIHDFNRWDRTYRAGVNIDGVGNRIAHCRIHDCSGSAIYLHGNDHQIEYNEIDHAVSDADDMGAFYMGRDPSEAGNKIRFNFFHDNGRDQGGHGTQSVFLDDGTAGTQVFGNIFFRTAGMAIRNYGGKNNYFENNLFIENVTADPSHGWETVKYHKWLHEGHDGLLPSRLREQVDILKAPYADRYPDLVRLYRDPPDQRRGNHIRHNLVVRSGSFSEGENWIEDNRITEENLGLVDLLTRCRDQRPETVSMAQVPGAIDLPFGAMGLPVTNSRSTADSRQTDRRDPEDDKESD